MSHHLIFVSFLSLLLCCSCSQQQSLESTTPSPKAAVTAVSDMPQAETPSPAASLEPSPSKTAPATPPPLMIHADAPLALPAIEKGTPVAKHGQLSVEGTVLKDANGAVYQLRGISTHGIQWFSQYLTPTLFCSLRDDLHVNAIRLALYADYSSLYTENQEDYTHILDQAVCDATKAGLYVIIDWHILEDENPMVHEQDALTFFNYVSTQYQNYPNVIYELCNEPNGNDVTWSEQIKPYAEEMITAIRSHDPDGIIIVGTPHWCQSPLSVIDDPLTEDNLLYAFHFYAGSHGSILRNQLETAVNEKKLPLIVSEFGTCEATGSGQVNEEQTKKWIAKLDEYHISWLNWSLCDKDESSALLLPGTPGGQPITDASLTESGKLIKQLLLSYPDDTQ